jgi:hypothetical protein
VKVGVSRPFGELENGRGLTREIVPAYHLWFPAPARTPNAEVEISFRQKGTLRVMEPANLYPKVNNAKVPIYV